MKISIKNREGIHKKFKIFQEDLLLILQKFQVRLRFQMQII